MPTLAVTNFNIVCATLGGFITLFGLVSYLFKEKFYLSEACLYFLSSGPPQCTDTGSSNFHACRCRLLSTRCEFREAS